MHIVPQHHHFVTPVDPDFIYKVIEIAGRTCYKSEDKTNEESAEPFIRGLIRRGHESVLEHACITLKFITDRGVSHELVRHRIASYSQESSRYCNYAKDKFSNEITYVLPHFCECDEQGVIVENPMSLSWACSCAFDELIYMKLIELGAKPQDARQVLNNSVKTEVMATFNMRSLRNMLRQRCSKAAHPQMRKLMRPLLDELVQQIPALFEDVLEAINKETT